MQIRKIGPQPSDQFQMLPNDLAREERLSFRARGIMAFINSHLDGFHLNADTLAQHGTEGRDAIRTAMNELIERDYLRRVRRQDEQGRWRTDLNVYIYGDAPAFVGQAKEAVTEEDLGEPTTGFQSSVGQAQVSQAVREDHQEDSSISPLSSAAAGDHSSTNVTTSAPIEPSSDPIPNTTSSEWPSPAAAGRTRIPTVLQWALRDAGAPVTDIDEWTAVWSTALATQWPEWAQSEVVNFPNEHLMEHLQRRRREGREPRPDLWLRFFVEDRVKQLALIAAAREDAAREFEDPNEREDRQNRHLPPDRSKDTIYCHGCGCDPNTEPHKEGCPVAARTGAPA